ncbi:hypothetical protein [Paenibacillus sp. JCM 10914]|uniref:hypothetical protein n=1 Tax=Paenibacillus sp. JCM 10914 TaxID=1236974 RepID=UPI0003CC2AFE|nr:hypothetical protein [Paenibacillus sp. JCM 10914]GAE07412.1 hypothetical protein JCM10914_3640 [Paenibacillus sp. JCM 10914]
MTPILIIVGELNPDSMPDVGLLLTEAIPDARFIQLAAQDRMPEPELLLPIFTEFL